MSDARAGWREIAVDLRLTPQESDEIAADDDPEPVEITDDHGEVVAVAELDVIDGEARVRLLRWNAAKATQEQALHYLNQAFRGEPRARGG